MRNKHLAEMDALAQTQKEVEKYAYTEFEKAIAENPSLLDQIKAKRRDYQRTDAYRERRRKAIAAKRAAARAKGDDPLTIQKVIRFANNVIDVVKNCPDHCPLCKEFKQTRKQWVKTETGYICRVCWNAIKRLNNG